MKQNQIGLNRTILYKMEFNWVGWNEWEQ